MTHDAAQGSGGCSAGYAAAFGCGFNKQVIDTTYSFESAIVRLPDGTIVVGDLDSWTDFQDGDCVQVTIDGKTYLVHSSNAALIHG